MAIGGSMLSFVTAAAAPIFWCFHAFVGEIYWDWLRCATQEPEPVPELNDSWDPEKEPPGESREEPVPEQD